MHLSRRAALVGAGALLLARPALAQLGPEAQYPDAPNEIIPEEKSKWFESLKRSEFRDRIVEVDSCCGVGDAYPIKILEDAYPPHVGIKENGLAVVTDPSAKTLQIPNGKDELGRMTYMQKYRPPITGKLEFAFSGNKLTREIEGNPTRSAWAFLRVVTTGESTTRAGTIDYVWCVVPLPPGY